MPKVLLLFLVFHVLLFSVNIHGQTDLQAMLDAEKSFERAAADQGVKNASLGVLSDDSVVFRPTAINGKDFWKSRVESAPMMLTRKVVDYDVSSNGMMGYTTGDWRLYPKGKGEDFATNGQFLTVWEKRLDGKFLATVDIGIQHDKLSAGETDRTSSVAKTTDSNIRGWSPADASMTFLKMSMTKAGLAGAYKKFAAANIRLLIEREPPILGKKDVVSEMKRYISIDFPKKVALLQAADMAYTWNPCQYANSGEGTESGNCLQIWKLRDNKWWIVISVFNRISNETKPELKIKQKSGKAK